jgi:hypothetical protein
MVVEDCCILDQIPMATIDVVTSFPVESEEGGHDITSPQKRKPV